MRIVTWNCNGALRRKFESLISLKADIYVVQECENPNVCRDEGYKNWAANHLWIGGNKNKGLGIFCSKGITLTKNIWDDDGTKYILSATINDGFNLVAVWNQQSESRTFRYIGQFWKYLQINKCKLNNSLIIGDFNSNKIWDGDYTICSHSKVVSELEDIGIRSLYHDFYKESQGQESTPTFFLQKNLLKRYHIDYAFADIDFMPDLKNLTIGDSINWLKISDHMPLIIDF